MRGREDPLGALLARAAGLAEGELQELLALQRTRLPLASLCYALGLADEETLARALSWQHRMPAVVLDRSVLSLDVLEGAAADLALGNDMLPLAEDKKHLFVASSDPHAVTDLVRELEFIKGKTVITHVALQLTLTRAIWACRRARARGERTVVGQLVDDRGAHKGRAICVVSEVAATPAPGATAEGRAHAAVIEDITKEMTFDDVIFAAEEEASIDPVDVRAVLGRARGDAFETGVGTGAGTGVETGPGLETSPELPTTDPLVAERRLVSPSTAVEQMVRPGGIELIDLDSGDGPAYHAFRGPPARVLVVDGDHATRQLVVDELADMGYLVQTASRGSEALAHITRDPPDAMVVDILLAEIDGFRICQAVKESAKYRRIAVVLVSAVVDSGRVTDEVVRQFGADAYFEKPLHVARLKARLQTLLAARGVDRPTGGQGTFEQAISLYRAGEIDAAVGELRRGLAEDPLSARHHFVLANLLHKKSEMFEAIDEYEATLELRPDYFPALTRLAYLYYKQGLHAKAIDTWRRSLPLCSDPSLRHNIEVFMRRLIADLGDP